MGIAKVNFILVVEVLPGEIFIASIFLVQRFSLYSCQEQNICMKFLLVVISLWSCTLFSCNKSSLPTPGKSVPEELTGKWHYAQSFYSIGGPLIYVSTENLKQWIEFKDNGTFLTNMPDFKNITKYSIVDSTKVKFTPANQQGISLFYFRLDATDNSLSLSPASPACIEGCGNKFKKR